MVVNLKAGLYRVLYFLRISLEGYTIDRITLQDCKFSLLSASITLCEFSVAPWLKK
jgi:O-glycosyl hydrolase